MARGKLRIVQGVGDYPPFTVPGQTYEPLPPGTFAGRKRRGLGASFQTVSHEHPHMEYPTGGGTAQFDGLPQHSGAFAARRNQMRRGSAHVGNTVLGMGFSLSDVTAALESGAATAAGAFLQTGSAQPVVQAAQQQAVQSAGASSFAWAQTHWKQIGLGILIGVVALGGTFYYLGRKK